MHSTIHIREAKRTDGEAMMALIHELALYEKAPEEVTISFNHFIESGFGEHPVWWSLVAEVEMEDGSLQIVGFALWYIRFSTWKGQRLYLEDIIVTETYRRQGVGHQLFEGLIHWGKSRGLQGMNWQVLDWNEPALQFYQKFGDVQFDPTWVNGKLDF
jgi:GNAT superfamily N-acetyltransferase